MDVVCALIGYAPARHRDETFSESHLNGLGLYETPRYKRLEASETFKGRSMKRFGYARVSTDDQDNAIQREVLQKAGCVHVFEEKASGTSTKGRPQLELALKMVSTGETLMVTRIDRLARSIGDLQVIVGQLAARGAKLQATEQPIDTSTAAGKAFLDMLGVFAEFETNLRRERQMEGIAKAKAAGAYKGRRPSIDPAQVRKLREEGVGPADIARKLKIGRASVYRVLGGA